MTCHLCTADLTAAPVVGTRDRDGVEIRRVQCETCGLVQADPMPSAEEIEAYYAGPYWRDRKPATLFTVTPSGRVETIEPSDAERYEATLDVQTRDRMRALEALGLAHGARVLEVGCGDGRTLAAMLAAGWDVHGIEPDEGKAAAARARVGAFRVSHATLDRVDVTGPADAVVSFHVVEHTRDPIGALVAMRRLLRPGGLVWLEVPDIDGAQQPLEGSWWQWAHLYDFSAHTLRAAMERAGLLDVEVHSSFAGLRAMGRHDPAVEPRGYVPPGPHRSPLVAYIEAASPEIRAEWDRYHAATHRLASKYRSARDMVGTMGDVLRARAVELLEAWDPDPYIHGLKNGQGLALARLDATCGLMGNAMAMAEASDGGER